MSNPLSLLRPVSLIGGALVALSSVVAYAAGSGPTEADYAAANALLASNIQGLVRNESVDPHWIGSSGRFWYQREGKKGPEFVVVTPKGMRSPAFDHAKLAQALSQTLRAPAVAGGLPPMTDALLNSDLSRLTARVDKKSVDCDLRQMRCQVLATSEPDPSLLPSPDGKWVAFTRANNLFVRSLAGGEVRQLTTDGAPYYSWGKLPDDMLVTIALKKAGIASQPYETYWSLDGRYLIAPRVDERKVAAYPYVEWVPTDGSRRPTLYPVRETFVGDRNTKKIDFFLFNLSTGRRTPISLPPHYHLDYFNGLVVGWSRSRGQVFLTAETQGTRSVGIFRLDLRTGSLHTVLVESSDTRVQTNTLEYSSPNVRLVDDGAELIWYSDRTGWGQLYLYDAQTGRLENAITGGPGNVEDIVAVDEARREIYFTMTGHEPGRDPYYRFLYRARLDGRGGMHLLTRADADHEFEPGACATLARLARIPPPMPLVNPSAGVFIDTWSTVSQPPISALRSTRNGHLIATLERADASRLYVIGWRPPERERVLAADGKTALYADYWAPYQMKSGTQYPAIDAAYGGPQVVVTPRNFVEAHGSNGPFSLGQAALARLGFAVVTVDGRGTPMRSRAFRDAGYIEFTQVGIDDHIAAIRELALKHPEMDIHSVGIQGWSWGGTFAAQAILSRPQFYKVAVSGAGVYDYSAMYYNAFDNMIGPPRYANGSVYRSAPADVPLNWRKVEVVTMADRLEGHLLLIAGDLDENVPSAQAFRLIDALTRANKPYDFVFLPNRNHGSGAADGYTIERTWDYFIQYLRGAPPVWDYKVRVGPVGPGF